MHTVSINNDHDQDHCSDHYKMAKLNTNLMQALYQDLWTIQEIDLQISKLIDSSHIVSWLEPTQKANQFTIQFDIDERTVGQFYIDLLESIIDRSSFQKLFQF